MSQEKVSQEAVCPVVEGNGPEELQLDTTHARRTVASQLSEGQRRVLVHLLRIAYPHSSFPDGPYERAAGKLEQSCYAVDADGRVLEEGLDRLDSPTAFLQLSKEDAVRRIEDIADSPFFALVHSATIVNLYDDHEVWDLLGYEGSSYELGGYLHRGFDDLDWLPEPRIAEYDGQPRREIVTEEMR